VRQTNRGVARCISEFKVLGIEAVHLAGVERIRMVDIHKYGVIERHAGGLQNGRHPVKRPLRLGRRAGRCLSVLIKTQA